MTGRRDRISSAGPGLRAAPGRLLPALLIAIVLLEVAVAWIRHRPDPEWRRLWRQGTARERVLALQVLTNRSGEPAVEAELVRRLLASPEPLLREFAFTTSITRFHESELQHDYLRRGAEPAERIRAGFFLRYRAGPVSRLEPEEFRRFLNALEEGARSGVP